MNIQAVSVTSIFLCSLIPEEQLKCRDFAGNQKQSLVTIAPDNRISHALLGLILSVHFQNLVLVKWNVRTLSEKEI